MVLTGGLEPPLSGRKPDVLATKRNQHNWSAGGESNSLSFETSVLQTVTLAVQSPALT